MKTLKFCFLATVFVLVNSNFEQNLDKVESTVVEAIKGILKEHFAPTEPKIDIFYMGPNSGAMVGKLLHENSFKVSVRVYELDLSVQVQMEAPSIFLFDSPAYYLDHIKKITWMAKNGVWHNHLIYIASQDFLGKYGSEYSTETGHLNFTKYLSINNNLGVHNQNHIQVVNHTTVDLIANFLFSPEKCSSFQYKTINRFSTDTMKWQSKTFIPEKYDNFHGCTLVAGYSPTIFSSIARPIFNVLAHHLNFSLIRNYTVAFHFVEMVQIQNVLNYKDFTFSSPLFSDHMTFTVPSGEPYTQLEKMFLMFDKATWICIGVTLGAAFLVIQIINLMAIYVQKFVFGRDVQTPTLNVADIFFNGSQFRVPGRNFARFLLMLFIMWSLIIRTCYQSEMYKNLQTDMRKPRVQTLDELNEQNFTLLYRKGDEISNYDISINRFKLSSSFEEAEARGFTMSDLTNYQNKLTMLVVRKVYELIVSQRFMDQASSFHLLNENTASIHFSLMFHRAYPFTEVFIKKVDELLAGGLIQEIKADSNEFRDSIKHEDEHKPQQLTMDHLGICFAAIAVCLVICFIVFVLEIATKWILTTKQYLERKQRV